MTDRNYTLVPQKYFKGRCPLQSRPGKPVGFGGNGAGEGCPDGLPCHEAPHAPTGMRPAAADDPFGWPEEMTAGERERHAEGLRSQDPKPIQQYVPVMVLESPCGRCVRGPGSRSMAERAGAAGSERRAKAKGKNGRRGGKPAVPKKYHGLLPKKRSREYGAEKILKGMRKKR